MYTKFIKSFNNFFGKKENYFFSFILIIFSISMLVSSTYALYNLIQRTNKFTIKYVSFKDDKGYYIENEGETEVTLLSYANGDALNPKDFNGKILKMYCLKNNVRNCFYIKSEYNIKYITFGFSVGIILLSLGLIFRKLYKIRNINYGTIKVFRPLFIVLFMFGAYLFTYQIYNLINYMKYNKNTNIVEGNIIGIYGNNYLVEYIVDDKHYSNLVKIPDKSKQTTINIEYNTINPNQSYKNETNYLLLILGIGISYVSMQIVLSENEIDKKIKINEKKQKKENYRRKK